jgi:hypothetical protein
MGSREGAWTVARPWEVEGAQLDGGGVDGAVGGCVGARRGKTHGIYREGLVGDVGVTVEIPPW